MNYPNNDWRAFLEKEQQLSYFITLTTALKEEFSLYTIYPQQEYIFHAFTLTPYENVKVVILGQDPYHQPNQAHGLSFSVLSSKLPPSLRNIFQEIKDDVGITNQNGDLSSWAKQGVLLLNTTLTVRDSTPKSHSHLGWITLIENTIKYLNQKDQVIVYLLWGNDAQSFAKWITNPKHYILRAAHPSPLSAYRGFLGCKHFSKVNEIMKKHNLSLVNWKT